jgi:shikimate kinase
VARQWPDKSSRPYKDDEIHTDFRLEAVAEARWPVYQGTNNFIFQQRNFV